MNSAYMPLRQRAEDGSEKWFDPKQWSENLYFLRRKAQMTQEQLCKELYAKIGAYRMWETGRNEPGILRLVQIADYYNVTLDALVKDNLWRTEGNK